MVLKAAETFGTYAVVREVGRGGMAVVYEAEHTGLRKRVALKVLHAPADEAVRRFLREGAAAARTRHEHIVEVHDAGVHEGTAYLVMELLEGESFAALLKREAPLPAERVADLLLPVVSALAAAHATGVVHRDVKPENLSLARSRRGEVAPKVVDFGIARLTALDGDAQRLTGSSALVGSIGYMSPEQVLNAETIGPPSDQYALGVVMFECVTGRLPLLKPSAFGTLNAILKGRVPRPSSFNPDVDPRLEALILRAMAREPDDRHPDLHALGAALFPLASPAAQAHWACEFGSPAADERPPTVVSRGARSLRVRFRALLALALLSLVGAVAWLRPRAPARRVAPVVASAPPRASASVVSDRWVNAPVASAPAAPTRIEPAPQRPLASPPAQPARQTGSPAPRGLRARGVRREPASASSPSPAPSSPTPESPAAPWLLRTTY